jgi:hypothetical protein
MPSRALAERPIARRAERRRAAATGQPAPHHAHAHTCERSAPSSFPMASATCPSSCSGFVRCTASSALTVLSTLRSRTTYGSTGSIIGTVSWVLLGPPPATCCSSAPRPPPPPPSSLSRPKLSRLRRTPPDLRRSPASAEAPIAALAEAAHAGIVLGSDARLCAIGLKSMGGATAAAALAPSASSAPPAPPGPPCWPSTVSPTKRAAALALAPPSSPHASCASDLLFGLRAPALIVRARTRSTLP